MNTLCLKKLNNQAKKRKYISMSSISESEECSTEVRKSFIYRVSQSTETDPSSIAPRVYIKKSTDTQLREERFALRVKGVIFVTKNRRRLKVEFHHTLNILIKWKIDIFSPKKSEALT